MGTYLVTYNPVCSNKKGRAAATYHKLPRFIDGSTRKEPDLELTYPSISSLCRGKNFAPRLEVGDIVIYLTKKGTYDGLKPSHYRLTAILSVMEVFDNHSDAAEWYMKNDIRIPSNCMVKGNKPVHAAKTIVTGCETAESAYNYRSKQHSKFLACENVVRPNLVNPPVLDVKSIFTSGIPGTQNPKKDGVTELQLAELKKSLKNSHPSQIANP